MPGPRRQHGGALRLLPSEQLIARHVDELFPGMNVVSVHPFRITRNADVTRDEEVADDLLSMISEELRERRFASVVRLEVAKAMPEYDRRFPHTRVGATAQRMFVKSMAFSI